MAYNPATASLTGWCRASFSGSPWTGVASAGTSGIIGHDLTEGSLPPSTGYAVNSLVPPDFNLNSNPSRLKWTPSSSFFSTTAFTCVLLVYIDRFPTSQTSAGFGPLSNTAIFSGDPGDICISVSSSNGGEVQLAMWDTTATVLRTVTMPISLHKWTTIIATGTSAGGITVSVDGVSSSSSGAFSGVFTIDTDLYLGVQPSNALYFDGRVLEVMTSDTANAMTYANFYDYASNRYNLASFLAFDIQTLPHKAWLKDYSGSAPWNGTASAGESGDGNHDLTAGVAPTSGTLNGHGTAIFNGTTTQLTADGFDSGYYAANKASFWFLVKAPTSSVGDLLSTTNGNMSIGISSGAVYLYLNGSPVAFGASVPNNIWCLVTVRWDGVNAAVGVNQLPGASGGTTIAAFSSNLSGFPSNTLSMSANIIFGYLAFEIAEWGVQPDLADKDYVNITDYVNARYALSLPGGTVKSFDPTGMMGLFGM